VNAIVIAIIAYFLISLAALLDKFLLSTKVKPWQYVFYVGLFGIFGLILVPFGFSLPGLEASLFSFFSGAIFILALAPLYFLVSKTEVTRASPLVGALVPIFTLLLAVAFLGDELSSVEIAAFAFLLLGGFTIIFRRGIIRQVVHNFGLALLAAFLFAVSFVTIKAGFNAGAGFISGYVIARMGGVLVSLLGLLIFKKRLLRSFKGSRVGVRSQVVWVGTNKILGAIGFLVLNYAIFLGNVSIIQALQGVQYVFLLVLGIVFGIFIKSLREQYSVKIVVIKIFAILLIVVGLGLASLNQRPSTNPGEVKKFGVTFSTVYADRLGLDYKETFAGILDNLGVRNFRLVAYWPEIEGKKDQYDFSRLDWLVEQVEKNNGEVILTLGRKVPRFPECHIPDWASSMDEKEQQKELLVLIEDIVLRYKESPKIGRLGLFIITLSLTSPAAPTPIASIFSLPRKSFKKLLIHKNHSSKFCFMLSGYISWRLNTTSPCQITAAIL